MTSKVLYPEVSHIKLKKYILWTLLLTAAAAAAAAGVLSLLGKIPKYIFQQLTTISAAVPGVCVCVCVRCIINPIMIHKSYNTAIQRRKKVKAQSGNQFHEFINS